MPKKLSLTPSSAGLHGAASSRRGKVESSRHGQSPHRGQSSPRGPPKNSTRNKERSGEVAAEAVLKQGSASETPEIDELNKLFGRQSSRKVRVGTAEPAEVNAAKKEQPPTKLEPVEELALVEADVSKEEQPAAETEAQEPLLRDDVRLALTTLDDRLVRVLEVGDIRLVRAAWLLAQPEGYRIQRRQDLEALEQSGASPSPLISANEAVALIRKGDRSAGILSYGCALCRLL